MNARRATILGFALAGLAWASPQAASIDDLCDRLFLPEGYQLDCTLRGGAGASERMAVVRPVEGAFAPLSELTIRPIEEPVDDPERWLREQLRIDLTGVEDAVSGLTESPDSPLAGSSIDEHLESWLDLLDSLAGLPLEGCGEPAARPAGDGWELECEWPLGPLRQYLTLRLVERDGEQYAMRIRAMNEQRLRHLVAIANSF
jgi:hypothetical protein